MEAFLHHLANERQVAASTHNVALSALLYLYKEVLAVELPWMSEVGRPSIRRRLPVVLSPEEIRAVFAGMDGSHLLLARLLYGAGMRISEALQLRIKDIEFERMTIIVREGKGGEDRATMLPQALVAQLRQQLANSNALWTADRAQQRNERRASVRTRKEIPARCDFMELDWVFPQDRLSIDPRSGIERWHHLYDQTFQRAFSVPCSPPASQSRPHRTRCGIPLRRMCCKPDMTSAPCRNCSAIRM